MFYSFILFFFTSVFASTFISGQIHEIDSENFPEQEPLLLLQNGEVIKMRSNQLAEIQNLHKTNKRNIFLFEIDQFRYLKGISHLKISSPLRPIFNKNFNTEYVPTTIASLGMAQSYHFEGKRNPKESQCFNRAMIWGYEWWKEHGVKSMKIFIFFTRNYIRRFNFEWWFHVAPYVHVKIDDRIVERVMDLKYTSRPTAFKDWSDIFMRNNADCAVIEKYSDYADYPYNGDCFLMRTPMYTYQPADLQMYEAWGYEKSDFNMDEVKSAYLEAFDINANL